MFIRVHLLFLTGCLLVNTACGPSPSSNKPSVQTPQPPAAVTYRFTAVDRIMPDYLELEEEIRRIIPADQRPLPWQ